MKTLKRFVSLALACVLALSMLTACGGSGGGSSDAIEKAVNKSLTSSNSELNLNHDATLDSKAKAFFDAVINNNFSLTEDELYAAAGIDTSTEYVDTVYDFMSNDLIAMGITELTLEAYLNGRTYTDFGYYSSYYTAPYDTEKSYATIVVFKYKSGGGTVSQPNHNAISNSIGLPYNSNLENKAKLLCEAVSSGKYNEDALFASAGIDTTCELPVELDDGAASADYISLALKEIIAEASSEGYTLTAFGLYTVTYTDYEEGETYPYTVVVFSYK